MAWRSTMACWGIRGDVNPANIVGWEIAVHGSARLSAVACRGVRLSQGCRVTSAHRGAWSGNEVGGASLDKGDGDVTHNICRLPDQTPRLQREEMVTACPAEWGNACGATTIRPDIRLRTWGNANGIGIWAGKLDGSKAGGEAGTTDITRSLHRGIGFLAAESKPRTHGFRLEQSSDHSPKRMQECDLASIKIGLKAIYAEREGQADVHSAVGGKAFLGVCIISVGCGDHVTQDRAPSASQTNVFRSCDLVMHRCYHPNDIHTVGASYNTRSSKVLGHVKHLGNSRSGSAVSDIQPGEKSPIIAIIGQLVDM